MAQAALDAGQMETASRLYTRLLDADPSSVAARTGLAEVAMANRDAALAASWHLAALQHATDADERHASLLAHARAAVAAGQLDDARRSFSLLTDPGANASVQHVAWGLNGLGTVCLLEGDPRCALAFVEQALLREPGEPALQRNLAFVLKTIASLPAPAQPTAVGATERPPTVAGMATEPDPPQASMPRPVFETPIPPVEDAAVPVDTVVDAPPPAEVGADTAPVADAAPGLDTDVDHRGPDMPAEATVDELPAELATTTLAALEIEDARVATGTPATTVAMDIEPSLDSTGLAGRDEEPWTSEDAPSQALDPDPWEEGDGADVGVVDDTESAADDGWYEDDDALAAPDPVVLPLAAAAPPAGLEPYLVDDAGGGYVQLGAFEELSRAYDVVDAFDGLIELPVVVDDVDVGDGTLHRVRIGPATTEDELSALIDAVEAAGYGPVRRRRASSGLGVSPSLESEADAATETPDAAAPIVIAEDDLTYVQVGAYAERYTADMVASDLGLLTDDPVTVDELTRDDGDSLYRVRVGPVAPEEAVALQELVATGRGDN